MTKKSLIFTFVFCILFILVFSYEKNTSIPILDLPILEDSQEKNTNKYIIDNEWTVKVNNIDEAHQIAVDNNIVLQSISPYGIARYKGYINPFVQEMYYQNKTDLQPNYLYYTNEVEINDPDRQAQFALDHLNAYKAWDLSLGENILVAVIDTGIDPDHDEFQDNISPLSYNAFHQTIGIEHVVDDVGHGTMVAGVIAAKQNNHIGISGIAPAAEILVIKANFDNEGSFAGSAIADGIYYAVDHGADVINMSLGGLYRDPIMEEACDYAKSQGVIVVASSGNDGLPIENYPAGYSSTISVGATTISKERASFSNFHRSVNIVAPGHEIYTTIPGNTYGNVSGTSFSSPYVAGVIALLLSYYTELENEMIINHLYASAEDLGQFGKDSHFGHGLANPFDAMTIPIHLLSFETFLGTPMDSMYVAEGRPFYVSQRPRLENHYFSGWYKEEALLNPWDFYNDVTDQAMTLYAKYEEGETTFPDDYDIVINQNNTISITAYLGLGGDVVIPSEIFNLPVTEIGSGAFIFNDNITSIVIPDTVEVIHPYAFSYMKAVTDIIIGSGVKHIDVAAFYNNESLVNIDIESVHLTSISNYAFANCINLQSVILPHTIENIQSNAFDNTFSLTVFQFPNQLKVINMYAFSNSSLEEIILPDSLEVIADYAFSNIVNLKSVYMGKNLSQIGQRVFIGNGQVEELMISNENTSFTIYDDVLYSHDKKTLIWHLPYRMSSSYIMLDTVENMYPGSFSNSKIESIEFNQIITHIPDEAFYASTKLKNVTIPDNVKTLGIYIFHKNYALESAVLPKRLVEIPHGMFDSCISLKSVTFPENLRIIRGAAFLITDLEKVILPETVEEIEMWAFAACIHLKEIYIPDGLKYIRNHTLSIYKDIEVPPNIIFFGTNGLPIGHMEELILPSSATEVLTQYLYYRYDETRKIDFGSAKDVHFYSPNGTRISEIIINEVTETVNFDFYSIVPVNVYIYGMHTTLSTGSKEFIIHTYEGSVAHQYALDNGMPIVLLDSENLYHQVEIHIDGPGHVIGAFPSVIKDYEMLNFKLEVEDGYMVYDIRVNGLMIINDERSYRILATEDLMIDVKIKPNDYIIDYDDIIIINQEIVKTNSNAERINYPSYDAQDQVITGFSNDYDFINLYLNDMYDVNANEYNHGKDVLHISFPEFIKHIPNLNEHISNVRTVYIPEGVETMDGFEQLERLTYVVLPSTLTSFPHFIDENGFIRGAFSYCGQLEYVIFKSSLIVDIPDYAFYETHKLKSVYFASDIEKIGMYAFYNNISLNEIILNHPDIEISDYAFMFLNYSVASSSRIPLPVHYYKLPKLKIISTGGLAIDYATLYNMTYEQDEKYSVAYLDEELDFVHIEIVTVHTDAISPVVPYKSPLDDQMYIFSSWDQNLDNIQQNIITHPTFTLTNRLYEVVFKDIYTKEILGIDYVEYGMDAMPPHTDKESNVKYNYDFFAWIGSYQNVLDDLVIYASYTRTLRSYLVYFYDWDDNVIDIQEIEYGHHVEAPELPYKYNYRLSHWSEDLTFIDGEKHIYPIRERNTYEVTFYDFYCNVIDRISVLEGDAAVPPEPPVIFGYHFLRWDNDINEILENKDVFSVYVPEQMTITYIEDEIYPVDIIKIISQQNATLMLDSNHHIHVTGYNPRGHLGIPMFDINYMINITDLFDLFDEEYIIDIASGGETTFALSSHHRVFALGSNEYGQMGLGYTSYDRFPVTDITSSFNLNENEIVESIIDIGNSVFALTNHHRILSWGNNDFGQLATLDNTQRSTPTDVTENFAFLDNEYPIYMNGGGISCGLLTNLGNIYMWGYNGNGQLGIGSFDQLTIPTIINSYIPLEIDETVESFTFSGGVAFVITSEKRVFAWGGNYYYTTTLPDQNNYPLPMEVTQNFSLEENEHMIEIIIGGSSAFGKTSMGRMLGWGYGRNGEMANGRRFELNRVIDMTSYLPIPLANIKSIYSRFFVSKNGEVYGWGSNSTGQLGNYSNRDQLSPLKIIFNASNVTQITYNYDDVIQLLASERTGHKFLGWYKDDEYLQQVDENFSLENDMILFAKWEVAQYTVRFLDEDGTVLKEEIVTYGQAATPPDDPVKEGDASKYYVFVGWDKVYTNITESIDISPIFNEVINTYTVRFLDEDGTVLKEEIVTYGQAATPPDDPVKEGDASKYYVFAGWDKVYTNITESIDISPTFNEVFYQFTVRFLDEDGTVLKEEIVTYGQAATPPDDPVKEGDASKYYVFAGWDNEYTNIVQSIDISPIFNEVLNTFTVRFLDEDGTVLKEEIVTYGQAATPPNNPTKQANQFYEYTFKGWDKDYLEVVESIDIYATYDTIELPQSYGLLPGIDTITKDSDWIDAGIYLNDDEYTYQTSGDVNTSQVGRYEVIYTIMLDLEEIHELKRIVHVISDESNEVIITLNPGISTLIKGANYNEAGATSNIGEITISGTVDTNNPGVYMIEYRVVHQEKTYRKTRFVIVYEVGLDLTVMNATIAQLYRKDDEE